jgi:hypothetical protein
MFRDFVYLDINRVQSIIAQLQQGLLNEVIEGSTEQRTGRLQMATNLLAMLLPVNVSGSVEQGRGSSLNESRVLHDYAFEVARLSLEENGLLEQDELDRDEVPEAGFVLVRGAAQILDYETFRKIAENWDTLDEIMNPTQSATERKKRKKENTWATEAGAMIDTFYQNAIRVRVTNQEDCSFIGPLAREHLREELSALIYKYGSNPEGEWTMLAEVSRIPLPGAAPDLDFDEMMVDEETNSVSNMLDQVNTMFNALQEVMGSVSYPDIAVSPVAVYREISPSPES